VKTEKER